MLPSRAGKYSSQDGAKPVAGTGSVADQIDAPGDEQAQVSANLVAAADWLQVPPHPGLVGDDCRVSGVCFPSPR
jgi:hypothetical protein